MVSKIPIQNIYYLLCYAWNKLEEGEKLYVSDSDYKNTLELFSRILINGCRQLFKKGIEKNYIEIQEEYRGIKGKIVFKESLSKNLFTQGKAICNFDRFDENILSNQILKSTLKIITRIKNIDKKIKDEVYEYYWKFAQIDEIDILPHLFSSVKVGRNNAIYDFLLKICKLIVENTALDETTGKHVFKDFLENDKAMASLFESFVRNFYIKEQNLFKVKREDIFWNINSIERNVLKRLPKMQTDISLESSQRKIIIDTKYYTKALNSHFEVEKYHSSNLYQLYAYLRNIEYKQGHSQNLFCEGILLYPSVSYSLDDEFTINNHKVFIKTLNLNENWQNIHKRLLDIVGIH